MFRFLIKYVISEVKYEKGKLGYTKDGKQMSTSWLMGEKTRKNRILKAVNNDKELAADIKEAMKYNKVDYVLSKVDRDGNVQTIRLDEHGNEIGVWP